MTARKAFHFGARAIVALAGFAAVAGAWAAPLAAGRYSAQFCTVPPQGEARCRPADVRVTATGMDVRASGDRYRIRFGEPQFVVNVREKGKPAAHFYADYRWVSDTVLRFRETQPTEWEVRLGARR